jgi:hypothetical protein
MKTIANSSTITAVEPIDNDFEKLWASSLTGEEFRARMHRHIDAWQWKE